MDKDGTYHLMVHAKIVKKNIQASSKALEGIEHFLGKKNIWINQWWLASMVIWWCGILLSKAFFKGKFLPPTNHWLTEKTGKSAESFDSWPIFWRPIMVEGNKQFCLDLIWLHSVMSSTDWSVEKLEEIDLTSKPPGRQVLLVVSFWAAKKPFTPVFLSMFWK